MKLTAFTVMVVLLFSALAFNVESVKGENGVIYIRADGSVDPPTAPIQRSGDIYTFTDNIYETIVVERNDTIIDGNGYRLQGNGTGYGFSLANNSNATIKNIEIRGFEYGIMVYVKEGYGNNRYNTIYNNTIIDNGIGISLDFEHYGLIIGNTIAGNEEGIRMRSSGYNSIVNNNITSNDLGILLEHCLTNNIVGNYIARNNEGVSQNSGWYNIIYHNNLINNMRHFIGYGGGIVENIWDDGYPSGGNYWSDYNGTDLYSGAFQNESGSDGIGDTPNILDERNVDNYPLMNFYWNPADINYDLKVDIYDVVLVCSAYNSTPTDTRWNPHCDITEPYGTIDIYDVVVIAGNYGKSW